MLGSQTILIGLVLLANFALAFGLFQTLKVYFSSVRLSRISTDQSFWSLEEKVMLSQLHLDFQFCTNRIDREK